MTAVFHHRSLVSVIFTAPSSAPAAARVRRGPGRPTGRCRRRGGRRDRTRARPARRSGRPARRRRRRRARLCAAARRSGRRRAHRTPRAARCPTATRVIAECRHCSRATCRAAASVSSRETCTCSTRGTGAAGIRRTPPRPFSSMSGGCATVARPSAHPATHAAVSAVTAAPRSGGGAQAGSRRARDAPSISPLRETSRPASSSRMTSTDCLEPARSVGLRRPFVAGHVLVHGLAAAERRPESTGEHLLEGRDRLRADHRVIPLTGRGDHAEREGRRGQRGAEPAPGVARLALRDAPRREVIGAHRAVEARPPRLGRRRRGDDSGGPAHARRGSRGRPSRESDASAHTGGGPCGARRINVGARGHAVPPTTTPLTGGRDGRREDA